MSWDDQPDEVRAARVLASFYMADKGIVEIRAEEAAQGRRDRTFFLSFGGIFGSQTLRCEGAEAVFKVIDMISKALDQDRGKVPAPAGATLMENAS